MDTYEKKYIDTLERAREWYNNPNSSSIGKSYLYAVFPELAESEDERILEIIKHCIENRYLHTSTIKGISQKQCFAWLEKQGEQKPIKMWHDVSEVPDEMQELLVEWESPDATWHDIAFYDAEIKAFRHLKQPINNVTRWAYVSDILSQSVTKTSEQGWSDTLEKQGEQKPFDYENANIQQKDFAPMVEPFDKYEGLTDFERTLADICIGWIGQELGWKQYIKDGADVLLKIAIKMFNSVQDASFEQKPTDNDMVEALRTEYEKGKADAFAEMQKEWSEDDEKRLQSCINILKAKSLMGKVDTANTMWLKSLKQRMGGKL